MHGVSEPPSLHAAVAFAADSSVNASNPPDANTSTGVNWTKSPSGGNGGGGDDGGKSTNVLMVALSWLQMEA